MGTPSTPQRLGLAVEQCLQEALEEWRGNYAGADTLQDAMAAYVDEVYVSTILKPAGRLGVFVEVKCRRAHKSDSYFFSLQRAGFRGYVHVDAPST